MSTRRHERMIRWYPPQWRERYGAEMTALLEDHDATAGGVPWRHRFGLARAGLAERARGAGLTGSGAGPERVRAGSVWVLCGWALFMVAGAVFAKFADNWWIGTPAVDRLPASASYDTVAVLGVVGCAIVALAGLLVVPSFVRLVRAGQWGTVRRAVWRVLLAAAVSALLLAGGLAWAHHLSRHARNGGSVVYAVAFVGIGLCVFVAVACATSAAVTVARRTELPGGVLRTLGAMALGLSAVMVLLFVAFVTWWATQAAYVPRVLLDGIGNGFPFTSSAVPPTLLFAGVFMLLGLVLAAGGAVRIVLSTRPGRGGPLIPQRSRPLHLWTVISTSGP